jgi:ABC-type transport system involved in multi-copper enzyme maturation permease subunit
MLKLIQHEARLIWREPRFWLPFLLPPLALVGTQVWMFSEATQAGMALAVDARLLYTLGALLAVMGGALSADSFAGERERNTLELLLALPVSASSVFWAKVLVIVPVPLFFALSAQILFWSFFPGHDLRMLGGALLYSLGICLLVTGFSVLVSMRAQSVRAAGQLNAVLVLLALVATQALVPVLATSIALMLGCVLGALGLSALLLLLALRNFRG